MTTLAATSGYMHLAALMDYPDEHTAEHCRQWLAEWADCVPGAVDPLRSWERRFNGVPLWKAQERYTRTFDLNPSCSLNVGYYLFGEDYQRGMFLAKLRGSQQDLGMPEEVELPDHLPVILRWLERIHGSEEYTEMVAECLLPVLHKIDEALIPKMNDKGEIEGEVSPYRDVLEAVVCVLEHDIEALG